MHSAVILIICSLIVGLLVGFAIRALMGRKRLTQLSKSLLEKDQRLTQLKAEAERREQVLRKTTDNKLATQAKYIETLLESRFTLRTNFTRIVLEILNLDGDCIDSRIYRGLRTGEGLTMRFVDHRIKSNTPGFLVKEASLIKNECSPGVGLKIIEQFKESTAVRINFPDGGTSTPEGINYAFRYIFDRGMLMSREEVAKSYALDPRQCESFSHINIIPTDHLEVEVLFPKNYKVPCRGFALVKDTVHPEQTAKLKLDTKERGMLLSIDKPLQGFEYLIEWDSPPKAEVEELRRQE